MDPSQDQINALINLYQSGQITKAEQACIELLQIHPKSLIILNMLGEIFADQGQLQKALQALNKAIQIKPNFAEAYSNRGSALKDLGQPEEAAESYLKAIGIQPDLQPAWGHLFFAVKAEISNYLFRK